MIRTVIPSPTSPGAFAVVRQGPGLPVTLEIDGFGTEQSAQRHADVLNRLYQRQQEAEATLALPPAERPIATGFYTDRDAA